MFPLQLYRKPLLEQGGIKVNAGSRGALRGGQPQLGQNPQVGICYLGSPL